MTLRVLAPLDGSAATWSAYERALALLAGRPGLVVTALNVRQPGFEGAPEDTVSAFEADEEDEIFPTEASSQKVLDHAVALGKKAGVTVQPVSVEGTHFEVILELSAKHHILLMHDLDSGSRSGRTAELMQTAACHVMLIRP